MFNQAHCPKSIAKFSMLLGGLCLLFFLHIWTVSVFIGVFDGIYQNEQHGML